MVSVTLTSSGSAQLLREQPDRNHSGQASYDVSQGPVLLSFPAPSTTYRYRKITAVACYLYLSAKSGDDLPHDITLNGLLGPFTAGTVTANTAPEAAPLYDSLGHRVLVTAYAAGLGWRYQDVPPASLARLVSNGLELGFASRYPAYDYYPAYPVAGTGAASYKPYLQVTFDSANIVAFFASLFPAAGGFAPKTAATRFAWSYGSDEASYAFPVQSSATFRWRVGSSGTVHTISCGTNLYCDVPAGTFTADDIQWQVAATLSSGQSLTSAWTPISTVDATSEARCVSPVSTIVNGDAPVTLAWEHIISTDTAPTKSELQYSTDGTTWTALATINGTELSYDVPAGTFASGSLYWRVRTYNSSSVAGSWSVPAACVVVAAPGAPSVSATQTPRPLISWQAQDQQAYEVRVDGVTNGPKYGTGKAYKWPHYLDDGVHTVEVRVQNSYSLWSPWGSGALTVTNIPGAAVTLAVTAGWEAALTWTDIGADAYVVYRNGLAIAKTTAANYVDPFSVGAVEYRVRAISNSNDNYSLSNRVTASVLVDQTLIADVRQRSWLSLRLTSEQDAPKVVYQSREVTLRHYVGQRYPSVEYSEHYSKSLTFTAAFTADNAQDQQALDVLVGRTVCVKTKGGEMVIGPLMATSKRLTQYLTAYECTVEQIEWPEEVQL